MSKIDLVTENYGYMDHMEALQDVLDDYSRQSWYACHEMHKVVLSLADPDETVAALEIGITCAESYTRQAEDKRRKALELLATLALDPDHEGDHMRLVRCAEVIEETGRELSTAYEWMRSELWHAGGTLYTVKEPDVEIIGVDNYEERLCDALGE